MREGVKEYCTPLAAMPIAPAKVRRAEDNCIDVGITDPPYGENTGL